MSRFQVVLPRILKSEGGKVDDPRDPGGRTNQGITQTTLNKRMSALGRKTYDVFNLTDADRDAIYRALYWDAVKADQLYAGLDYVMMDGAVHSGPTQAGKWLQRALGPYYTGNIDGVLGPLTISAVENYPNKTQLIDAVLDRRLAFLQALSAYSVYSRGWNRRVSEVRQIAKAEAANQMPIIALAPAAGKAPITDAKAIPSTVGGNSTATAGATTTTVAFGLERAQDMLAPYAGTSQIVQTIFVTLVVAGVVVTVGGFAWRFLSKRKATKLVDALNLSDAPNAVA